MSDSESGRRRRLTDDGTFEAGSKNGPHIGIAFGLFIVASLHRNVFVESGLSILGGIILLYGLRSNRATPDRERRGTVVPSVRKLIVYSIISPIILFSGTLSVYLALDLPLTSFPLGERLAVALGVRGEQASQARIVRVETPVNSSDATALPRKDGVWQAEFPIRDPSNLGIGHIIDSNCQEANVRAPDDFVMHAHYPAVPDQKRYVTYFFDKPTQVSGVRILQHRNGVIKIVGYIRNSIDEGWTEMGDAWSKIENTRRVQAFDRDGVPDTFRFQKPGVGKMFRFYIQTTSNPDGSFAFFRACPLNAKDEPYKAAQP